jgi:hypothetical protein
MTPDDELARKKLAIETKLRRADQDIVRRQFELARAQFAWQQSQAEHSGWERLITPTGVVLVAAALGLTGTAIGKWADYQATKRQQETTIILSANNGTQALSPQSQNVQRARNLLWFAKAGYIDLPKKFVNELETASLLAGQPVPPPFESGAAPGSTVAFVELQPGTDVSLVRGQSVTLRIKAAYSLPAGSGLLSTVVQDAKNALLANARHEVTVGSGTELFNLEFVVPDTKTVDVYVFLSSKGNSTTSTVAKVTFNVVEK